jgi:tetratricopeptide (TPR) repeat protein
MTLRTFALLSLVLGASGASAQSTSHLVASGDSAYAKFESERALREYEAAVADDPRDHVALWKASRSAVDLGETTTDDARKTEMFKKGETFARRAIEVNPQDADGHFCLARALGRRALSVGVRDRIKFGTEVRKEALAALTIDPTHPGALHVMGVWNAEVMRLNGIQRFFAEKVLGGRVLGEAKWKDAVSYMERAVAADPQRLTHHLDLARIYADVGQTSKAREQYQIVLQGVQTDFNDPLYKRQAESELKKLK